MAICAYFIQLHRLVRGAGSRRLGPSAEGAGAPEVSEKMRAVLEYARKLTDDPSRVMEADAKAVLAAGWDETALYHAAAVTALFNFMNRLVEGLGIELSPSYVKAASERLADRGYLPLIGMLSRQ